MATTKNSKATKSEVNSVVRMILKSNTTWYMKALTLIVFPFIIIYLATCGVLQMILYPVLYVIITLLGDMSLREEVARSIKHVWSTNYWFWF